LHPEPTSEFLLSTLNAKNIKPVSQKIDVQQPEVQEINIPELEVQWNDSEPKGVSLARQFGTLFSIEALRALCSTSGFHRNVVLSFDPHLNMSAGTQIQ